MESRFEKAVRSLAAGNVTLDEARRIAGLREPTIAERQAGLTAIANDVYTRRRQARVERQSSPLQVSVNDDDDDDAGDDAAPPLENNDDVYERRRQQREQRSLKD